MVEVSKIVEGSSHDRHVLAAPVAACTVDLNSDDACLLACLLAAKVLKPSFREHRLKSVLVSLLSGTLALPNLRPAETVFLKRIFGIQYLQKLYS